MAGRKITYSKVGDNYDTKDPIQKTLQIVRKNKFSAINAGYVKNGLGQVVIKPKNLIYSSETLNLR